MGFASDPEISLVTPRSTVEIHLPDGRVLCGPRNSPVEKFLRALPEEESPPIIGAVVNDELRELTYPIKIDSTVRPVTMGESDGMLIYRRSLVFLLETAFDNLFPVKGKQWTVLRVDHSVSSGGYYCQVSDLIKNEDASSSTSQSMESPRSLTPDELNGLEMEMRRMVEADLPFIRREMPLPQAVEYFRSTGEDEKARLLTHRQKDYLTVYQLQDHLDYHHGYMAPSTGYLRWFRLTPTGDGFTLRFPRRHAPTQLDPLPEYPNLLDAFRRYGRWLDLLGISSVGALNDAIRDRRGGEIILVSEAFHEQHVAEIARQIADKRTSSNPAEQVRVVLISGPSSSGKTTFSKRLAVQLLARGLPPFPLAMDNFFIERELTPLDEEGKPDFESVRALNLARMDEDLRHLIAGERVQLPRYNFRTGRSEPGDEIQLKNGEIIILEGIHGLNPALFPQFPVQHTFRVYVSALTQLNLDRHNRISTTDTRLIRRIVRDARERGYSAQQTIQRWESVQRGEKDYIFPYQENSDVMFNSALVYELSALKPLAEPLLRQVQFGTPEFIEAKRLLALLEWFLPLESDLIPENSILREFIGESSLHEFTLWHSHDSGEPNGHQLRSR
jgi:uridine kinase